MNAHVSATAHRSAAARLFAAMLALVALSACSQPFSWKEEILLHDGRTIVAERVDIGGGGSNPGETSSPKERTIVFPDPAVPGKTYRHSVTGESNYLLVDFENGAPWVLVRVGPFRTDTYCPVGSYRTFRWNGNSWSTVLYSELPTRFSNPNMAYSYKRFAIEPYGDIRKRDETVTSKMIKELLLDKEKAYASESAWRLVKKSGNGAPVDCELRRQDIESNWNFHSPQGSSSTQGEKK